MAQLGRMTSMLCEKAGVPWFRLRVGAVGVPAVVHPETAHLSLAGNLPGLEGANLRAALAEAMGVDVLIRCAKAVIVMDPIGPMSITGNCLVTTPSRRPVFNDDLLVVAMLDHMDNINDAAERSSG